MQTIIDGSNIQRSHWIDLVKLDKTQILEFIDGKQKVKEGTYLIRTQSNRTGAPVFYHYINPVMAEKIQLLPVDDAVEVMDILVCGGEKSDAFSQILTFSEAGELWGLADSTLRVARLEGRFRDDEIKKSGGTWLVTRQAMERMYGGLNNG